MLERNKREDDIDWSKLANASPKPKRLYLEEEDCVGLFHCPVQACNYDAHTEAAENTERTNTVGTFIWTKSQTALRLKKRVKATRMKATIPRLSVKLGQLRLLTYQATLLEIFLPGSPAMAEAVKAITKHNKLSASV